jgi:hypothetical protein
MMAWWEVFLWGFMRPSSQVFPQTIIEGIGELDVVTGRKDLEYGEFFI